ncbi:MAG TPA: tyrosine-protein phosphatase, partial [Polyangiaceae bacterium]|nr:tyrosine-protein phosphatase [Polyangiaceae bacterium]
ACCLWAPSFWSALGLVLAVGGCSSEITLEPLPGVVGREIIDHKTARPILARSDVMVPDTSAPGSDGGAAGAPAETSCKPNQTVLSGLVTNARDLGGTPLATGESVACGAIYRGAPLRVSETGCAEVAGLGLRTLIDLRIEGERTGSPDSDCVAATRVFAPLPIPYGLSATDYLNDLHATESIATVFHTFGDPDAYPIYFHCTFGRDRTGVVGALLLQALGATREVVMEEYLLSRPNVGAYPDALDAVLDEIAQQGGAEAVLKSIGITDAELDVMRSHAVALE